MRTDVALRDLLRRGRASARLSQREAAHRASVSPGWWKRVESATEISVTEDRLLDMLQAVGVRPAHLEGIGHPDLAALLAKREDFARDAAGPDSLEEYLMHAPASDDVKRHLLVTARALREIKEGRGTDPFPDQFPPPRHGD